MATNVAILFTGKDAGARTLARQLQRDFDDLRETGNRLNGVLAGLGAGLSVAGIVQYTRAVTASLSSLDDLSEMTGESVENLSTLAAEARISGLEFDKLGGFANRLAKGLTDADDETKDVAAALKAIGVQARDANGELKSTPVLMREIAQALQGFKAGPGQQALLQALGGKSGAELLPFLNDLAKTQELVSRVTGEQAAQAESAERAWRKFFLEINQVGQELVSAALPALEGTARGLGDLVRANDALNRTSVAEWAQSGAVALAILADTLGGLGRLVYAVAGSFAVVGADIQRAVDQVDPKVGLEESVRRREAVVADANKRWADLWNYNGRAVEEAVRRSLEAVRIGNQALADFDKNADARDLRLRNKQTLKFTGGERPDDSAARAAEKRLREFQAYQKGLYDSALAAAKAEQAYIDMENALDAAEWDRYSRGVQNYREEIQALEDQLDALAGVAEENRKIALTLAFEDALAKNPNRYTDAQKEAIVKGIAGIREEVKQTTNEAERFALVFTSAFDQLIDSGGDLGDVFRALLRDVTKLVLQIALLEPLAKSLREAFSAAGGSGGGAGGIASIFGSLFGGGKAAGGPVRGGTAYLVGERGPELFVPGGNGRIVPSGALRAGAQVSMTFNYNVGAAYGDAALASALEANRRATIASLTDMQARGRLAFAG